MRSPCCPLFAFALVSVVSVPVARAVLGPEVSLSLISGKAYGAGGINVVANGRSAITTYNGYEYAAFYGYEGFSTPTEGANKDRYVCVARRRVGTTEWVASRTGYAATAGNITDDHCSIAIGIDGDGYLHVNFGTHADPMRYIVSTQKVDAIGWGTAAISAKSVSATGIGNLPNGSPAPTAAFSYPEFLNIPGSKDLLFVYRDGGSGNGDTYFVRYSSTATASQVGTAGRFTGWQVLNHAAVGTTSSGADNNVSAYPNSFARDSQGNLLMSWTWRDTGGYQTNHDITFAKSADNGVTWTDVRGNLLPATMSPLNTTPDVRIPQGSSLVNTTTMAVDGHDRPVIATWFAPGTADGNYVRQYMLEYWDGSQWRESQITHRTAESIYGTDGTPTTSVPTNDGDVRELGRPLVLVDKGDRVIVLMNYQDAGGGLMAAYSSDRVNWDFVTLSSDNLGLFEAASYDHDLWASQNKLSLLYQRFGTGDPTVDSMIYSLDWDAAAFFATVPEPSSLAACGLAASLLVGRRRR